MSKKLTQAEFLAKAVAVHGVGRYDYSQVAYVKSGAKVKIICPAHGVFEQSPNNHISQKQGCPLCGKAKNGANLSLLSKQRFLTTTQFISKAQAIHGVGRYDYSQTVYVGRHKMLSIGCPQHGIFEQRSGNHLNGAGCPACAGITRNQFAQPINAAEFISKAQAIHGVGRYDYSQTVYVGSTKKIKIHCHQHGQFEITPSSHLGQKAGCPVCGQAKANNANRITQAEFIAKAQAVHGTNAYDYSQTVYTGCYTEVRIICPHHGVFMQKPINHNSAASGCPKCGRILINESVKRHWIERAAGQFCILYFIRLFNEHESFYKVGITYRSIKGRYAPAFLNGYRYEIIARHESKNAAAVWDWEQSILETFVHLRYKPKNAFAGATECFSSCEEILNIFPL